MSESIVINLPDGIKEALDVAASEEGASRTELIDIALLGTTCSSEDFETFASD